MSEEEIASTIDYSGLRQLFDGTAESEVTERTCLHCLDLAGYESDGDGNDTHQCTRTGFREFFQPGYTYASSRRR